jgi:site-specific DNA recombinase
MGSYAMRRGHEARPDSGTASGPKALHALLLGYDTNPHRRRGRLYRYYVCLGASRRGHHTCPVRSIAGSEVEGLVLGQVRRLLASPELVARTITAVRRENGAAEGAVLGEGDVIEALGALDPVWDELYPAEQARILRLLVERIDVAPDGISVTLHAAGIWSLVAELANQEAPTLAASEPLLEAAD